MVLKIQRLIGVGLCRKFLGVLLLCSLTITSAFAEVNWTKYSYFQNWGGLNDQLSSTEIQDNEATDIQNVVFDTGGALKKRFGYRTIPGGASSAVSSGTVAITGLSFYEKNDGSRYVFSTINVGGKAYAVSKTYAVGGGLPTGAWSGVNDYAGLTANYSNSNLASFAIAEDSLIFAMPSASPTKPFKWSGSGITTLTSDADCPTASIVVYHKNHLFLSGNTTYPSRIYFSALDDITNWTATDFFDVQTSDGTQVRGMVSAFDSLYIFKDKSIWRLSGNERDTFILQKMVDGIGTLSHQSIAVVNNVIYFTTSQNDIAAYDGGYNVVFLSSKIRSTISGLNFSRATGNLGLAFSTYRYNDQDYYCALSTAGSSTNDKILLFDTAYKAWTKFSGMTPNAWCVGEDANGKNILILGDYSGYIFEYPTTEYVDGAVSSAITAFYQTKWFRYPEISLSDKYWRLLKTHVLTETTNNTYLDVDCRSDYESEGKSFSINISQSGAKWDSSTWDIDKWSGQTLLVDRHEIEKGKYMFQIKYLNDVISQGFTIFGWENFIEPAGQI